MKKILTLAVSVFSALTLSAQAGSALLIPSDSRSLAMGVSGLQPQAPKLDATVFYGMWAPQTVSNTQIGGEVFFRLSDRLSLSAEGRKLSDKPYEIVNQKGITEGTFTPSDLIAGLGGSFAVTDAITAGLKLKMLSSAIAPDAKGSAFCADLSVLYGGESFVAGLTLKNLGSKLDYGEGGYALPAMATIGGTFSPLSGLTLAAEADYLFSGAVMAGLGAEYTVLNMISVRGGFHYGDAQNALPTYVSLGLGARFAGVRLDASLLTASKALGNTLLVGLGYSF